MRRRQRILLGVLSVIAVAGILVGSGTAWYLFSGRWTVAASQPHFAPVRWAAERVYRASVEQHAAAIPSGTLAEADVAEGGRLYGENCARCHATPGGERPVWAGGMRPVPPHLPDEGTGFEAAEIAWLLRHGIKMSGMPAWQDTLSEDEILSVTAFVDRLPDVSAPQYAQMLRTEEEPSQTAPAQEAGVAAAGQNAAPASETEADAGGPAAKIEMTNALSYVPATVTVKTGEMVRWTNPSDIRHTVTADESKASDPSHVVLPEGAEPFDSGNIEPGGSWSYRFEVAGRYTYFCIPHEGAAMIGEVIVEG